MNRKIIAGILMIFVMIQSIHISNVNAKNAEMVMVYGNRYRSLMQEVDKGLENAYMLYHKGNYKDALEVSISSIELVDADIQKKLLKFYEES